MKPLLIVNPASASGAMRERWAEAERTLRSEGFAYEAVFTERRGHASEIARDALQRGFDLLVAVGGDGTLHEVVNGMLADGKVINPHATLGLIPGGTGSDFARSAALPLAMLAAARSLARSAGTRPIDVAEAIWRAAGKEERRYFVNVAGMGFDAEVIERTERRGKWGRGTLPYLAALAATALRYRNKDVTLRVDGKQVRGRMHSVIICNGRYFGGGMCIAPNARFDDGQLDVIVLGDFGPLATLWHAPKVYRGAHLALSRVSEYHGRTVTVESEQRMLIEADGELLGAGPATFRILPAALQFTA